MSIADLMASAMVTMVHASAMLAGQESSVIFSIRAVTTESATETTEFANVTIASKANFAKSKTFVAATKLTAVYLASVNLILDCVIVTSAFQVITVKSLICAVMLIADKMVLAMVLLGNVPATTVLAESFVKLKIYVVMSIAD